MLLSVLALLLITYAQAWAWSTDQKGRFEAGNKAYRAGDFKQAIDVYQELIREKAYSGVLYLNLGNAFYRNQQTGEAILIYERGLKVEPRNEDIRYNLNYVRSRLEYSIKDTRNWYVKALESLMNRFSAHEAILACLFAYFLIISSWAFVLFFRQGLPWGWIRKFLLIQFVLTLAVAGIKYVQTHMIRDAIVIAKQAEVRYGPSSTDQVSFRLGQGLKVYVVDHQEDWSRILLTNGESGWVKNSLIAEVVQP